MLLLLELADLVVSLFVYLLLCGNYCLIFHGAVAVHSVAQKRISWADHAIREHKLAS